MLLCLRIHLLLTLIFSNYFLSNIWIEPSDELKIKKIELYTAENNINIRSTTYPVTLNSLKNSSSYGTLLLTEKVGLNTALDKNFNNEKKFNSSFTVSSFSDNSMIRNIDDNWRGQNSFILKNSYTNKNFSMNLNLHLIDGSYDEKKIILNGSHISFTKWNVVFGFGFIDRWWG
ncbi:MAG: hypothetical protein ACJ0BA_03735, partial [Gammaproteobacteria bacterium]